MYKLSGRLKLLLSLSPFFLSVAASTNFTQCLDTFRASGNATGGTDFAGRPVNNSQGAVSLTYNVCKSLCGTGQEAFNWSVFSQQFSAWLLPWLALVSQLPFGAENRIDNLLSGESLMVRVNLLDKSLTYHRRSVALTVGSPTLAAFSLAITALNTRWAIGRFSTIEYPNHKEATMALIYLQQVPLHLTTHDGLLASLIVLPENDDWWECLVDRLEQTYVWTIFAATSIAWVIAAFLFTIVDSFGTLGSNINSDGQGVGTLWLWLIPIVVGWLWTPVCSYEKLKAAIDKANDIAYVAAPQTDDPPSRVIYVPRMEGLRMYNKKEVVARDAARAAPVFNYARIWEWSSAVEMIAQAFENADRRAKSHTPVNSNPGNEWVYPEERRSTHHRDNRAGSIEQVQDYCGFPIIGHEEPKSIPSGVWGRVFVASVFALGLQWSTTGSATITVVFTPTNGLGCRSGFYILYGTVSTTIWFTLLLSSYLAHCAEVKHDHGNPSRSKLNSANLAKLLATFLRRLSTFAAVCSSLGVILACVFQFSDTYSTCYCNSSVLGRHAQNAFNIIASGYNYSATRAAWIGGIILAGGYVFLFLFSLYLILEHWNNLTHG